MSVDVDPCKNSNLDQDTITVMTWIVPPLISIPGLVVDTIAMVRLGVCSNCVCNKKVADGVDFVSQPPLLLPKLIFHGILILLLIVILILTNVYFCPESAILINIVAPVLIVFYTFHSVNVYRLREFKKALRAANLDAVDAENDDPSAIDLLTMTRRGVIRKEPRATGNNGARPPANGTAAEETKA